MAMLPLPSRSISATALSSRTGPRIRRARQSAQTRELTAEQRLARQHAPRAWERLALTLSLAPHRLPLLMPALAHLSAFWDTWAVRSPSNAARRATLRRRLAWERRHVLAALRVARHASARASWPTTTTTTTAAAADARWRAEVRDLLERLGVVIETTTDWHGVTHFTACDLTPARRACLTQPSLDALLFDTDEPAEDPAAGLAERLPLSRPHDATTQPALPAIQI